MCERAMLLGGSVAIESKQRKGTTISVQIPLEDWVPIRVNKGGQKCCSHNTG